MTNPELLSAMEMLFQRCLNVAKAKNADYAEEADAFLNFRRHGRFGILVRIDDKLCRLHNFERKGYFEVSAETILDTVTDAINYFALYYLYEEKEIKRERRDETDI